MSVKPDFRVTNENAPAVAAIAARLHGMPLAIELAAARIKLFSPDALRARLEDQLGLLSAGARDLPERQQTLRGAIAWSYDMLDDGHRRLLDRLSAFEGGVDLAAAEAVCGPSTELGIEVVDGLVALADQSLIRAVDTTGDPRFHVLDTIHEYAAEQLAARGETDAVAARHSTWFLELAQRIAPDLAGAEQRRLLDRLELEHDNIRAVLDRAMAAGDARCSDRAGLRRLAVLAEARPSFRGPASPGRDEPGALVAERPDPPGTAPRGARRRLLVAGRHPLDARRLHRGRGAVALPR